GWIANETPGRSVQEVNALIESKESKVMATGKMGPKEKALFVAGTRVIFNLVDNDGRPCFKDFEQKYTCSLWTFGKESAASEIVEMYTEFIDFMLNPEPPLMQRCDMRVTAVFTHPDGTTSTYDED